MLAALGVGGVSLALGACTSGSDDDRAGPASTTTAATSVPTATRDPRRTAATVEQELIADATAVLAAHPGLAPTVTPVRDAHSTHLRALVGDSAATPGAATPTPTAARTATPADALRGLAALERSGARLHAAAAARDAVGPADARLIASLAAYCAAQDVLLTEAAR